MKEILSFQSVPERTIPLFLEAVHFTQIGEAVNEGEEMHSDFHDPVQKVVRKETLQIDRYPGYRTRAGK